MSHLSSERLAALADEPGTAPELAHLATCEACARERRSFVALLALAQTERARIGEPVSSWEGIEREIRGGRGTRDEGRGTPGATGAPRGTRHGSRYVRAASRIAASVLLVGGGVVAGRYSAGAPLVPDESRAVGGGGAGAPAVNAPATPGAQPAAFVSDSGPAAFTSLEQARVARARYEALYQSAAAFIAQHDTAMVAPESPAAMRTRLAALDRVDRAMREAMHEAPYDPVINGYYLTTIGQRERTLHQLNTVLPVGMRINSF